MKLRISNLNDMYTKLCALNGLSDKGHAPPESAVRRSRRHAVSGDVCVSFEKARQFLLDIAEIGRVTGNQSIPADLEQLKYGCVMCCRVGCGDETKRSPL